LRLPPLEVLLGFFVDTKLTRLINVRHFFITFNLLDILTRRDVKRIQPPRERKKVVEFWQRGRRKDLVLEVSQKDFILERAFDEMAV